MLYPNYDLCADAVRTYGIVSKIDNRVKESKMRKLWLIGGFLVMSQCLMLTAQTTVTTTGGNSGSIPLFAGTSSISNSAITQLNGNIGIGTTAPITPFEYIGGWTIFGLDTTTANGMFTMGKTPQVQLIGNGNGNNPPSIGLLQLNIGGTNVSPQGEPALYLGSTRGTTATSRVAVAGGDALGFIGFYGDDGTSVRNLGASIYSYVDTSLTPVSTGVVPASLYLDTVTSLYFRTGHSTRVIISPNGYMGIGTTTPGASLEVDGNVKLTNGSGASITFADGTIQSTAWTGSLCGGDYAESVDVTGDRTHYEPGDVLVIDPEHPGHFLKSADRYSALVAGIYSTKPGLIGRRQTSNPKTSTTEVPMAMVGIVPTKVSAENGPIKTGDLLVTSSTLGYAMKGTDRSLLTGAIVGKALGNLDSGRGVIEVLVSLQ